MKITPTGFSPTDTIGSGTEAITDAARPDAVASQDPITQVAHELAAGAITRQEAVARIASTAMDAVGAVPDAMRSEIQEMIELALETNPELRDLVARLG